MQTKMRVMVKRILTKYNYPPDKQPEAVITILEQAYPVCRDQCVIPVYNFQSDPDFIIFIAPTLAIKNRSGKIRERFSFRNRIPIFRSKTTHDFHFQTGSRLKNGFGNISIVDMVHWYPGFMGKSISDFHFKIDHRFLFSNRIPIFNLQS